MNSKVTVFQFYSILILTRLLTTLTYIPEYTENITASDKMILTLFCIIFGTLIYIPVYILNKKYGGENQKTFGTFSKIKAVIFSIVFFYFSVSTVSRLDLFAGTVVFPETDAKFLLLLVVIFCCYSAYLGIEPIARSAVIFIAPILLSLSFVFLALWKKTDLLNLTPPFYNGVLPVVKASLNSTGRTVEYAVIAALFPFVTGNHKKGFLVWRISQSVITAIVFFFEATILGAFSEAQLFPVYAVASMARFSFFRGLGAIITGLWIVCAFLKTSLLIFLQAKLISEAFGVNRITVIAVVGALLAAVCMLISGSVERFNIIDTSSVKFVLILISVPILAIVELIMRRRRKCAKQ